MTEFEIAVEKLYKTFAKYPFVSYMEGCPCCVSDADKLSLHSKQLRKLEEEDILKYATKAISTWGNVNDFKHYLPRIFELAAREKLMLSTFIVLGKLEYGKWLEWKKKEQDAIRDFLKAWWKHKINHRYFDAELLIEINKLTKNLSSLLNDWNLDVEKQGFRNYVELVRYNYKDLQNKKRYFKELNEQEVDIFTDWIAINIHTLEKGFFKYEKEDVEFSTKISDALYFFEQIVKE